MFISKWRITTARVPRKFSKHDKMINNYVQRKWSANAEIKQQIIIKDVYKKKFYG